jgi:hypothetical protein
MVTSRQKQQTMTLRNCAGMRQYCLYLGYSDFSAALETTYDYIYLLACATAPSYSDLKGCVRNKQKLHGGQELETSKIDVMIREYRVATQIPNLFRIQVIIQSIKDNEYIIKIITTKRIKQIDDTVFR